MSLQWVILAEIFLYPHHTDLFESSAKLPETVFMYKKASATVILCKARVTYVVQSFQGVQRWTVQAPPISLPTNSFND